MPQNSILVSGASTGIGEACARHLAAQGWRVFAGVRKAADARRLQHAAANIQPVILDVTKPAHITRALASVHRSVGKDGLQALLNNAGIAVGGPLEFLPLSEWRRQMEVNFFGLVALTQACLPLLRAGHGRVINVSSIGGRIVAPLLAPYSASKFALEATAMAYGANWRRGVCRWCPFRPAALTRPSGPNRWARPSACAAACHAKRRACMAR